LLAADTHHPAISDVVEAVAAARGLIVASPVYKAAYTGLLKAGTATAGHRRCILRGGGLIPPGDGHRLMAGAPTDLVRPGHVLPVPA
jgi:methylmalonyl-CoA mutase cobalamin-binding subunit